jgi:hypothetical protein
MVKKRNNIFPNGELMELGQPAAARLLAIAPVPVCSFWVHYGPFCIQLEFCMCGSAGVLQCGKRLNTHYHVGAHFWLPQQGLAKQDSRIKPDNNRDIHDPESGS